MGKHQNQIVTMKKQVLALLMDVAPPTRATISRAFEPADFDVMWAANVSEAMDLSMRHHVDLLLLDLSQPLRTGREIFERLKTLNFGAPVVILTEHESAYEETVANQPGAVLQKPFSVAALAYAVRSLLGMPPADVALSAKQDTGSRDSTTKSDNFREMLSQRYNAPYGLSASHRDWGINE